LDDVIDWQILDKSKEAISNQTPVKLNFDIVNTDRAVGAILSNEISKKYDGDGLPEDTIHVKFTGSAGQSFGAFGAKGLFFELEGESNDYFGKGLSGSKLVVYPDRKAPYDPGKYITIGNVALYGATSGEVYILGKAGERFAVRNSGVHAVVEGVGDHGCEYMTGGSVTVLGDTGRNFAAGMSGGVAYMYDPDDEFKPLCNMESVELDPIDDDDEEHLKKMLEKHLNFTRSKRAGYILDNWKSELNNFIKVMPSDYKKVLLSKEVKMKTAV